MLCYAVPPSSSGGSFRECSFQLQLLRLRLLCTISFDRNSHPISCYSLNRHSVFIDILHQISNRFCGTCVTEIIAKLHMVQFLGVVLPSTSLFLTSSKLLQQAATCKKTKKTKQKHNISFLLERIHSDSLARIPQLLLK